MVSDDHPGPKREVLPEASWQRCYVHFLSNALDHLLRKHTDDCLLELRWLYDLHDLAEVRRQLAQWLQRWQGIHRKFCDWVEANMLTNRWTSGRTRLSVGFMHPPAVSAVSGLRDHNR